MLKKLMRPIGCFLVVSFILLNVNVPRVKAQMVGRLWRATGLIHWKPSKG